MIRILLVDDDVELAAMLAEYLEREGFAVEVANDGQTGLERALSGEFALIVLDVMMPRKSGIDILNQIRQRGALPVLMLTAKGDDADRIIGLELGADDYVPKPCTARELCARIRAILRRVEGTGSSSREPIVVGELTIVSETRLASWEGKVLDLTSTEFSLLEVLARNAGQTVSKEELSSQALGRPLAKFDRSIEVHLSRIREKLGVRKDGRSSIQTVYRRGYVFLRG
jgi:two-component system OmpR family response regulator